MVFLRRAYTRWSYETSLSEGQAGRPVSCYTGPMRVLRLPQVHAIPICYVDKPRAMQLPRHRSLRRAGSQQAGLPSTQL